MPVGLALSIGAIPVLCFALRYLCGIWRSRRSKESRPIPSSLEMAGQSIGGANRNRTDDLLNAIQALSQLSYGPISHGFGNPARFSSPLMRAPLRRPARRWRVSRRW
jgi:hypothetical protein